MPGLSGRAMGTRLSLRVALIACAALTAGALSAPTAFAENSQSSPKIIAMKALSNHAAASSVGSRKPAMEAGVGGQSALELKNALAAQLNSPVLIVQANSPAAVGSLAALAVTKHITVRNQFRALQTLSIEVPPGQTTKSIAEFKLLPGVTSVRAAIPQTLFGAPNDPDYVVHQRGYLDAVAATAAWSTHHGSSAVTIAIIDSGVDVTHPDLNRKIIGSYNAVDRSTDVTDLIGHGTFVAGVAGAETDNGVGVAGAGYDSSLLAVKVADASGNIYDDAAAAGIMWAADHGAQIMNISFGSAFSSELEKKAIDYAAAKGVLIVAAAGNDGSHGNPTFYPAAYSNVLAVGATDGNHRAAFSEFGSWVDIAAPGVSIYSTSPRAGSSFFGPSYAVGDGTSFASPLVAGEAALVLASKPSMSLSDLRSALVNSAHGFGGLGLGAGRVDFAAAFNHVRPHGAPTMQNPIAGGAVAGVISLSAKSTAPKLRFSIDGKAIGNLITPSAGRAISPWATWGLSNGRHTVTAVGCSAAGIECTAGVSVAVTVANRIPTISSPEGSTTISGDFTATATAAGGGLAFVVDGVKRGFDATPPYSLTYSGSALSDGRHRIRVQQCSVSGAVCAGPSSKEVVFNARSLHPTISSFAPNPFSPNGDHRNDDATVTLHVTQTQTATVRIVDVRGTTVRGPLSLGRLDNGNRTWKWNGQNNAGRRTPDGVYTLVLMTAKTVSGTVLHGSASRAIGLDTVAPRMSAIAGANATFYPRRDNYLDSFSPTVTLGEAGRLTLTIRNSAGVVRVISASKALGRQSLSWNGRNRADAVAPAGAYTWTLTVVDAAGNTRTSASRRVTLSLKALVVKTTTLSNGGSSYVAAGPSDSNCAKVSKSLSAFAPQGVWLYDACQPRSGDVAAAFYNFTLPAAVGYRSARLDAYGSTFDGPTAFYGAFMNTATKKYDISAATVISHRADQWYTLGSVNPTRYHDSRRIVATSAFIATSTGYLSDFDIAQVRLVVTYTVLV